MVDKRVATYEKPAGRNAAVVFEGPARSGIGNSWPFGIVLLVAVLAVVYLMALRNDTPSFRHHAIAHAARDVGFAANNVETATQDAAGNLIRK